jgi:hypothetical protein|nr:DUF2252 family protein [Kofleriaceae bacterium]
MRRLGMLVLAAAAACSRSPDPDHPKPDAPAGVDSGTDATAAGLPPPIAAADFPNALDMAFIRGLQTWVDDPTFALKWQDMQTAPIAFLGAANSAYHADLASRATPLPGGEVICHGDSKLDNFGWIEAAGSGSDAALGGFSDADFDDAGACPAAADILHFLLATDIQLSDPTLDDAVLDAYIDTVTSDANAVAVDPTTAPAWTSERSDGVDGDTKNSKIKLGGEVVAPSTDELTAVTALVAGDTRFPTSLLDVAKDVKTTGGSAGLRRFWVLVEDKTHPRTIIELKELAEPGTEFGPHSTTYDGDDRFDVLKPFWWQVAAPGDHFGVDLLGTHFLARDRYGKVTPDATKLPSSQTDGFLLAEASLMAQRHRGAWAGVDPAALRSWLHASAATLSARWLAAFQAAQ